MIVHIQSGYTMLRSKLLVCLFTVVMSGRLHAQELFVYSEPASNMPAGSLGIRLSNWMMDEQVTDHINYHFIPELMWGINKHLMIHTEGYFSNRTNYLQAEGAALYAKYRFYSHDKLYRHFRMAAFARASVNNSDIHQQEIETNGHNSGYQLGLITTQLLHKMALSLTMYYHRAVDNLDGNEFPAAQSNKAFNYTLSAGRLLLPKKYSGYKQTNLNIMAELIGQLQPESGRQYLDIAPSLQLIFNSQTRVDIGYRHNIYSNMQRTAPNGFLLRIEHLLFSII
jgi:hypothetical protein